MATSHYWRVVKNLIVSPNVRFLTERGWAEQPRSGSQLPCGKGNVVFRTPVPAYKHSAAVFLNLLGCIPTALAHPKNPKRPEWEVEILADCARRLGAVLSSRFSVLG